MFFLIPVGSEEGVRRLPYLTIGLIAFNTLIYFITSMVLNNQVHRLNQINQQLFDIESKYMYRIIEEDPGILQHGTIDQLREKFADDGIIPLESEDYTRWHLLYKDYKRQRAELVFERWGFVPKRFDVLKILSSMFIHANFFHLLFNMLFLWLVGCNIEDDWSWKLFLGLYISAGIVASLIHTAAFPHSEVPLIGASGAIAGVMGAFMIRHYKTKIRFAYFLWFFLKPYYGTFSIYAGIALPFWFLQQIIGASWSVESGTAYWAHIGGFVFGTGVGAAMKFFGLEQKYIAPMVEESFEKLKVSPKMKEIYKKMDAGDTAGAVPLLLTILNEEPQNFDAPLMLGRIYFEKGHLDDAGLMYSRALQSIIRLDDIELLISTFEEMEEKKLVDKINEKLLYELAGFLERHKKYQLAVRAFGFYIQLFPQSKVRPKAIYRTYILFKDRLNDPNMAQRAYAFLKKEYPDSPF